MGWWRGENNAADGQGQHPGVLVNGATFANGIVGGAFRLDGTNDYVEIGDHLALTPTSMTIEAWIAPNSITGTRYIAAKYDPSITNGMSWVVYISGGQVFFVVYQGTSARGVRTTSQSLFPGYWQHVAVTFDQAAQIASLDDMRIYVGGYERAKTALFSNTITQITDSSTPMTIGTARNSSGIPTGFYDGWIDELQLLSRALSPNEIEGIYQAGSSGQCPQVPACFYPVDDLAAFWPGDGNGLDAAGVHDGALLNGASFASGVVNQAFALDGTNDYVEIPDAPDLTPATQLTVHAWVYPNSTTGSTNLLSKHDTSVSSGRSWLLSQTGGALRFAVAQGTVERVVQTTAPILVNSAWQHVAATVDLGVSPASMALYVNGALIPAPATGGAPALIQDSTTPVRIGATRVSGAISGYWNGRIDEAQVIGRQLSPQEIQKIYDAGSAGQCGDADADGVLDPDDGCPAVANAGQQDLDADGTGDACDTDADGDGVADASDNCPALWNADQLNRSPGGAGDACTDTDGDGLSDEDELRFFGRSPDDPDSDDDSYGDALHMTPAPWCETELTCPEPDCGTFGQTVALSGDRLVVGAPGYDESGGGSPDHGAAFAYERNGTTWNFIGRLDSYTSAFDRGGRSLALAGDVAVLGSEGTYYASATIFRRSSSGWSAEGSVSPLSNVTSIDVNGDLLVLGLAENSDLDYLAGAARVYRRINGVWTLEQTLQASPVRPLDQFGATVAILGDRIAVGAPGDNDALSGRTFLFRRWRGQWIREALLESAGLPPGNSFGAALDGEGTDLLIGAPLGDWYGVLANSGGMEASTRAGVLWSPPLHMVLPFDVSSGSMFAASLALGSRTAAIGATGFSHAFVGRKTLTSPEPGTSGWVATRLVPGRPGPLGQFGASVASDDKTVVVGGRNQLIGGITTDFVSIFEARLESDPDCDGVLGTADSCPTVPNPDQKNTDGTNDGGDACDNDDDNDGHDDDADNCPLVSNPAQQDNDLDSIGDYCDPCPLAGAPDPDNDGVCGAADNCPNLYNPSQLDTDGTEGGDGCDPDRDGDLVPDESDNCPAIWNPLVPDPDNPPALYQPDADGDGVGDACDVPDDALNCLGSSGSRCTGSFGQSYYQPRFRFFLDPASTFSRLPQDTTTSLGICQIVGMQNASAVVDFLPAAGATGLACCAWEVECRDGSDNLIQCSSIQGAPQPPEARLDGSYAFGVTSFALPFGSTTTATYNGDSDIFPDQCDNCPRIANEDQADADHDGYGDACECGDPAPNGLSDWVDVQAMREAMTFGTALPRPEKCDAVRRPTDATPAETNQLPPGCNVADLTVIRQAAVEPGLWPGADRGCPAAAP